MQTDHLAELIQRARRAWAEGDSNAFAQTMSRAIEMALEGTELRTALENAVLAYPSVNTLRLLSQAAQYVSK